MRRLPRTKTASANAAVRAHGAARLPLAALCLVLGTSVRAADLLPEAGYGAAEIGLPRYFPRSDGLDQVVRRRPAPPIRVGCLPRRAPVPTDAPDDPSYVGSAYGLGRPSYYGFVPPRGVDDPFGRPLLPYYP